MKREPDAIDYARILIVDDEQHNRTLLEVMLDAEGFSIQTAKSGEEALEMIAVEHPDLILLDVMMPGMDGFAVVAAVKNDPATKNVPIIMVTARDDREARLQSLNAGAEDFLSKPVDRAELTVRVRNLLRLKAYGDYCDKYARKLKRAVKIQTAALREERDKAQEYLDTAQVILLKLDTNRRIILINQYACSILGWTQEELIGRDWAEACLPARIQEKTKARFDDLLKSEFSIVENAVVTKSGKELLIEWRNRTTSDEAGNVMGTFSSGTDITERNLATEGLRVTEERMRFALESADVGIWDVDYTTGVIRWSNILEQQYGFAPGMFNGTNEAFVERIHPDDRATSLAAIATARDTGADFSNHNRAVWPDGTVRWLSGAGRVQVDEQGRAVRGVGISMDVTERRTLEGQFQQAQKMEAIGQLASGVAHDFNNLLTVILGFSDLLAADFAPSSDHGKDLGEIIKAAKRATGLTAQLLAFSRQQVLHARPLDLNNLITDMTGMLGRLIGEHIEITEVLAPDLPLCLADRGQIEQVVMNLVVNARDAMNDGGRLTIETAAVEFRDSPLHGEMITAGAYVMLAVTDNGAGMTKDTQRRLFEPFFTTKKTGEGTGLGLSTTYGIVKQSKGYIWVYSELGLGTTFKVYLPCAGNEAQSDVFVPDIVAPHHNGGETVLLVEDEAGVHQLSTRILINAGYRVLGAANGDEAEKLFAIHRDTIDLVVTDVVMPGCGGPELLRRLRESKPSVRVVYMSGYTEQTAAQKSGIEQGLPFMQKPFAASELVRQVREALDAHN